MTKLDRLRRASDVAAELASLVETMAEVGECDVRDEMRAITQCLTACLMRAERQALHERGLRHGARAS